MNETVQQADWGGVYLLQTVERFVLMDVGAEWVTLVDAFTGEVFESLDNGEFEAAVADDDFEAVSQPVLDAPAEYAEALLDNAVVAVDADEPQGFDSFDPVDAAFAVAATTLSTEEAAAYRERLDA